MKMTFRWYGEGDSIPLAYIRQIHGMSGVVTAVYDIPVGGVWPLERILHLKKLCEEQGLAMEVIESVPVHEDIKLGRPSREGYIEAYRQTLFHLGAAGVKCVCYNFMPVFDWLRTELAAPQPDGSTALAYRHEALLGLDVRNLHLPGWDESYTTGELNSLLDAYKGMSHRQLFDNLIYFLRGILPACEETGIHMAIHPDDPPWDMFGLPRIISKQSDYDNLFAALPSRHNGMTLCTGSLGAGRDNDLIALIERYADRVHFAHIRQLKYAGEFDFTEAGHMTDKGDLDIFGVVRALVANGFDGYVRPDHGRNIWGETGKPGYGLYDRALGAAYLHGLFEAAEKLLRR
ncbi:MAG: mannonate dehydratase [Eubacteriales bacterium]